MKHLEMVQPGRRQGPAALTALRAACRSRLGWLLDPGLMPAPFGSDCSHSLLAAMLDMLLPLWQVLVLWHRREEIVTAPMHRAFPPKGTQPPTFRLQYGTLFWEPTWLCRLRAGPVPASPRPQSLLPPLHVAAPVAQVAPHRHWNL